MIRETGLGKLELRIFFLLSSGTYRIQCPLYNRCTDSTSLPPRILSPFQSQWKMSGISNQSKASVRALQDPPLRNPPPPIIFSSLIPYSFGFEPHNNKPRSPLTTITVPCNRQHKLESSPPHRFFSLFISPPHLSHFEYIQFDESLTNSLTRWLALDIQGSKLQKDIAYLEPLSRHRNIMPLYDLVP